MHHSTDFAVKKQWQEDCAADAADALRCAIPLALPYAQEIWDKIQPKDPFICGAFIMWFAHSWGEDARQMLPEECLKLFGDRISDVVQLFPE